MDEGDKSEMEREMIRRGENEGWVNEWGCDGQQVLDDARNGNGWDVRG